MTTFFRHSKDWSLIGLLLIIFDLYPIVVSVLLSLDFVDLWRSLRRHFVVWFSP